IFPLLWPPPIGSDSRSHTVSVHVCCDCSTCASHTTPSRKDATHSTPHCALSLITGINSRSTRPNSRRGVSASSLCRIENRSLATASQYSIHSLLLVAIHFLNS